MSHFINGPSPHRVGAFGTAGFPNQFSRSQGTRGGDQRGDTEQSDPSRSHWQKLPGITSATRNSEYLGSGRCSEVSIIREVLCFFFQALLFKSHPTFGKTHLYAEVFYPHSWDSKPSNLLLSSLIFFQESSWMTRAKVLS